jgi:hypothetical protein
MEFSWEEEREKIRGELKISRKSMNKICSGISRFDRKSVTQWTQDNPEEFKEMVDSYIRYTEGEERFHNRMSEVKLTMAGIDMKEFQTLSRDPLWNTRRQAERTLDKGLKPFASLLSESFSALDGCVDRLEKLGQPFGQVCALILIKARNLGIGCYSLSLDALAQEAGALFRPALECLELLTYVRLDPGTRTAEALENRLPKAGVIAQKIEGKFKGARDHLNAHASHVSLAPEAVKHLVDFRAGRLRLIQSFNKAVLRENLRILLAILIWLAIEAVNCVTVGEGNTDNALADKVEDLKRRVFVLIDGTRS